MKKFGLLFVMVLFLFFQTSLTAQNVSPQFSELRGMEDAQGNTHLLYRIYTSQSNGPNVSGSNDIYNLIPGTSTDTIFLYDGYTCSIYMGWGATVSAYDIWNKELSKYIFTGELVNCFEPYFVISRFDSNIVYGDWFNYINKIIISRQNDSLIFALPNLISADGGFNWDTLQLAHQLISVSPIDDKVFFSNDFTTSNISAIFKSTNSGNTFTLVDTGGNDWFPNFYYDTDGNHIYREYSTGYPNRSLKASANQGNAYTWQNIYSTNNDFYISLDESQSGAIYLADGKKIFYSSNYGNTFNLFKELDKKIIGIYKKPNSNKLYAATKYKIYEITNTTISHVKSLSIIDELAFYPLKVGNKWIYDYTSTDWIMNSIVDIYYREVLSEKMKQNGKKYFEILEKFVYLGITDTVYERIDTTEGKVYRYEPDCPNSEQFIEELVLEVNDSTFASRFESCIEHPPTELVSQQGYNLWGFYGMNRNYLSSSLLTSDYNLYSEIGLVYIKLSDDNYFRTFILKGMVKDGVVYGDTTLTDVGDENNSIPTVYRLEQNYPNPFNPITKIRWQSPSAGHQTLKVYDVLGNEVVTLVDEFRAAGSYEVDFHPASSIKNLASGIYFYRLQAGSFVETKKMILLK